MIKYISFYDIKKDKLITELDSDACAGIHQKTAEYVDVSTRKLDPSNPTELKLIIHGFSTDTGSSGNSDGLTRDLRVLSRLSLMSSFLGVTYFLL